MGERLVSALAVVAIAALAVPVLAQTAAPKGATPTKSAKPWTPPRTAWGDPDLQGSYTNTDESGTPFERPAEFEGKRVEDVTAAELARAFQQRNDIRAEHAAKCCSSN